jgi:hypothetical protein
MNIKVLTAVFGLFLTTLAIKGNAQTAYTEGYASYNTTVHGQPATVKSYFTPDSTAVVITFGPGTVKMLANAKHDYFALLLDIPVASIKKAGIATPSEIEDGMASMPSFTFTPTAETKQISGFNCKKVVAKDTKTSKTYDVWITNDISVPQTAIPLYYTAIGGFPVQYTSFQQGQEVNITVLSVTGGKAPAGTFGISSDFDKVSMDELGGH